MRTFRLWFLSLFLVGAAALSVHAMFGIEVRSKLEIQNAIMESIRSVEVSFETTGGRVYSTTINSSSPSKVFSVGSPNRYTLSVMMLEMPEISTGTVKANVTTSENRSVSCETPARRYPRMLMVTTSVNKETKDLTCWISGDWNEGVYQPF